MSTSGEDLRNLLKSVGGVRKSDALRTQPEERKEVDYEVEELDDGPVDIRDVEPLNVAGFIDGIQNAAIIAYRDHRPVYLTYVAAAVVGARAVPVAVDEQMTVMCSALDYDWVCENAGDIEVKRFGATDPDAVALEAFGLLGSSRETIERSLVNDYLDSGDERSLLIDGSLIARPTDERIVGVVKTTLTRYIKDETELRTLKEGHRSRRFVIPAGKGHKSPRYSAYVRLGDARNQHWNFALLRVEAFSPEVIDALAARCFIERQGAGAHDRRWDRHIGGVRMVEDFLRSRRPSVF